MSVVSTYRNWLTGLKIAIGSVLVLWSNLTLAQVTPDTTLGVESSVVTPNVEIGGVVSERIDGGAIRGANLFHSFQEFNVREGTGVYFTNPQGIENILSRVTGASRSEILGKLGVLGNANLFLINPNGIIFGSNASLNVGGSFVATTANAIQFGEGGFFSTTNREAPLPLLTINPSALFFNQITPAAIQNNSVARAGTDPAGFNAFGLRVPDGKSLLLIGGNINMNRGQLNAYGGRVELGGIASLGTVGLLFDGNSVSASFPANSTRADVSLTNRARVFVEAAGGGSIAVNARNLEISGQSILSGGIGEGLGSIGTVAGDITLDATGEIKIVRSLVSNDVLGQGNGGNVFLRTSNSISLADSSISSAIDPGVVGKGGDINISGGSLTLTDSSQLTTFVGDADRNQPGGRGQAGNVNINVTGAVTISKLLSGIFSRLERGDVGNGGNINITADSFSLTNGAILDTATLGKGDAGNVNINVRGAVTIAGISTVTINGMEVGIPSRIFNSVAQGAIGNGGNINITADSLFLADGARLNTVTQGQGNAGSVFVQAKDSISITGSALISTGVIPSIETVRQGGDINIRAASLSITDGAQLQTPIYGDPQTQLAGQGDAGDVNIDVTGAVTIAGRNEEGPSGIFSVVSQGGFLGNGGNININAGSFSLIDGARLATNTFGQGNAGTIEINATDAVKIAGTNFIDGSSSALSTETDSFGKGGNMIIKTRDFTLSDGAVLSAATSNAGNSGNITVTASRIEAINGGQLLSTSSGNGNAGKITVNATDWVIINGREPTFNDRIARGGLIRNVENGISGFFVQSQGSGSAGDIEVSAPEIRLDNSGKLSADSASGNGGNINLFVGKLLLLRHESQISATAGIAGSRGDGGNISIHTPNGFIVSVPDENSDITANAFEGNGGIINIEAFGVYGIQPRQDNTSLSDITTKSELGISGTTRLDTQSINPSQELVPLEAQPVDIANLIANSCIARSSRRQQGTFVITGSGSLPSRPGEALMSQYTFGNVRTVSNTAPSLNSTRRLEQKGDPILEAQGIYRLPSGELVLSRECAD